MFYTNTRNPYKCNWSCVLTVRTIIHRRAISWRTRVSFKYWSLNLEYIRRVMFCIIVDYGAARWSPRKYKVRKIIARQHRSWLDSVRSGPVRWIRWAYFVMPLFIQDKMSIAEDRLNRADCGTLFRKRNENCSWNWCVCLNFKDQLEAIR